MKSQLIKRVISLVMTVCAGVFCMSAADQAKLYISDFTVQGTDPVTVEIMLDNPTPVIAYNFTIEMPEGLKIVEGSALKTARFNEGQQFGFRNNIFAVISMQDKPFFKSYGSVGTFQVEATAPITGEQEVEITLKNITIVGQDFSDNVTIAEQTTTVTMTEKEDPVKLVLSVVPEAAVVNPGGVQEISVAMNNNADIQGMQMNIILPEGFSLVNGGSGIFEQSARLGGGATIQARTDGNSTNVVISDFFANEILKKGEGEFMKFKVQVPEDFAAESAQIQISNIQASVNFKTKKAAAVTMELTNGVKAYDQAKSEIEALREALTAALETIETECPDVKDLFPGDEISGRIDNLASDVDMAYEDLTLTDDYDSVMEPATEISSAIESLVEAAKAAQKANDEEAAAELARQEAYTNANALVEGLSGSLDSALASIEENCPDVKDYFTGEDIASSIVDLQDSIDAAYEDKTLVENYDELTAPATGIQEAIAELIKDAKNAQKEFEDNAAAESARLEAYKNANEVVSGLNESLKEALAVIDGTCPDVKDSFTGSEIAESIKNMQDAIDAALEDKTIVENYDDLVAPATSIEEAIAKLVDDAKASQKAFEENAALESARLKANAALAALDKAFADALAEIDSECPDVKHLYTGVYIQQQITVLRNAVNAAYEDKTLAEKYDEVMAPEATITESIAKLVADAKAAQKAVEDAETARQKYNTEAYEADLATVDELQNKLDAAKIEINENYPDYDCTASYDKIAAAIAALKAKADKEYERVADEGKYAYTVDTMQVDDMIEKMMNEARTSGIELILADQLNGDYKIYTLDGKQVPELQHGKVNIIVKADGTRLKVFVK